MVWLIATFMQSAESYRISKGTGALSVFIRVGLLLTLIATALLAVGCSGASAVYDQRVAKRPGHFAVYLRHERSKLDHSRDERAFGRQPLDRLQLGEQRFQRRQRLLLPKRRLSEFQHVARRRRAANLQANATKGAATLLTIPMAGYVSADRNGGMAMFAITTTPTTHQTTAGLTGTPNPNYLQHRFVPSYASKARRPSQLFAEPQHDRRRGVSRRICQLGEPSDTLGKQQVFYDLDNEPDLVVQHARRSASCSATYQELVNDSINYAAAIKAVSPNAMVFGGVNYGWNGYTSLQNAPDQSTDPTITNKTLLNFQAAYFKQMHAADIAAGKRLVDVLDMHWYPEAHGIQTACASLGHRQSSAATVPRACSGHAIAVGSHLRLQYRSRPWAKTVGSRTIRCRINLLALRRRLIPRRSNCYRAKNRWSINTIPA